MRRFDEDQPYACRRECLIKYLAPVDRVPCGEILSFPYNKKCLGTSNKKNQTVRNLYRQAMNDCLKLCNVTPCHETAFVTLYQSVRFPGRDHNLIKILTANDADLVTTYLARMSFVEFFSFLSGCFSFWFGLSVTSVSCNKKIRSSRPFFTRSS